ncbi:exosporium leader peptide-containing protein (plasmid) [Bacillus mycoides]|uniref:exosporium leader peptide-containing protein n=1 Tax=Bacillus mycoides TaxID=1405 RepID=UPI003F7571DC
MSEENGFDSHGILNSAALDSNSIGPTLPPIPPFTLPSGPTGATGITGPMGATGSTGPTGPVPQSAFRAENPTSQSITEISTKVLFPTPIFDLNSEYDPLNSTFIPKQSGIYSIIASVVPFPDTPTIDQKFILLINVNGNPIERVDNYRENFNVNTVLMGILGLQYLVLI